MSKTDQSKKGNDLNFMPFNTKPIVEYSPNRNDKTGEEYPNCCTSHKTMYAAANEWFDKFPQTTEIQEQVQKQNFKKQNYSDYPDKLLIKIALTQNFIAAKIDSELWYEDINDYIDYTVYSFGSLAFGVENFLNVIINYLEEEKFAVYEVKRTRIIDAVKHYYSESELEFMTIDEIQKYYNDWIKLFPFDLIYFAQVKSYFEDKIPVNGQPKYNKYLEMEMNTLPRKQELIDGLARVTNEILTHINGLWWYKQGRLKEPDKIALQLVLERRKLESDEGYLEKSRDKQGYRKILKTWIKQEKKFIKEITPFLNKLEVTNSGLTDLITHEEHVRITEAILVQYKNITGKQLKLLFLALRKENLLPTGNILSKFHRACELSFPWEISTRQAVSKYVYNKLVDAETLEEMRKFLRAVISK